MGRVTDDNSQGNVHHQPRSVIDDHSHEHQPQGPETMADLYPPSLDDDINYDPTKLPKQEPIPPYEQSTVPFPPPQSDAHNFHNAPNAEMQFHKQQQFQQQQLLQQQQYQQQLLLQQQLQQQQQQQQGQGIQMGHPTMPPSPFIMNPAATPGQPRAWNSSLFDCMNDPENALITAFFPCVTFGQIAEVVDSGTSSCGTSGMLYGCITFTLAMPCIMSCTYRTKMRSQFGLVESPAPDWLVHCFCECCALCQEYRQLKDMGIDPAIGWMGNVAKKQQQQNQQFQMTPPMGQVMM